MWICIGFIVGVILGALCSWIFVERHFNNGNFEVNESDANKDVYKMMVNDFDKLHKRKWLLLRITRK